MPSYGFSLRASTRKGGGAGKLYLRVVHGSESRSVTTDYKVLPEEWDAVGRRLVIPYGRNARSRELAEMETSMMGDLRRMDAVIRNLEREGAYTIDQLMTRYRGVIKNNTLVAYAEKLAGELERDGNPRTARAYRTAACRLQLFAGIKDLSHEHINATLMNDFQQALKSEGRSMNTISFYMRTLRAIYNKAVAEGRVQRRMEDIFGGVYTGVATTRKRSLTHSELATLTAHDPTADTKGAGGEPLPDHLAQALAMFLFCYHARGMSFVDMANLKKADMRGDTITYRRQKTGQPIELRVLPVMRRIIEWFAPRVAGSFYLFPVITDNDKDFNLQYESGLRLQNKRLKQLSNHCGISRKFSTHAARHSWATIAKNAGLPLAVISEGLGHSNQKTTEIYLASLERSVLDQASKVVSDAIINDQPVGPGRGRGRGRAIEIYDSGAPVRYSGFGKSGYAGV